MKKATFTIDDQFHVVGIYDGKIDCPLPLFPLESVQVIADWCEPQLDDIDCLNNGELPVMIGGVPFYKYLDDETQSVVFLTRMQPQMIDGVNYYDIGQNTWLWELSCDLCANIEDETNCDYTEGMTLCGDCEAYLQLADKIDGGK